MRIRVANSTEEKGFLLNITRFLNVNEISCDVSYPLFQDSISLLLDAVRTRNEELAQTWKKSEQWATVEQLCSMPLLLSYFII